VDKQINSRNYLNTSHIQNYWHLQTLPYNKQKRKAPSAPQYRHSLGGPFTQHIQFKKTALPEKLWATLGSNQLSELHRHNHKMCWATCGDDYIQQAAWPQVRKTSTPFALAPADGFYEW